MDVVVHAAEASSPPGVSRTRVAGNLDLALLPVEVQEDAMSAMGVDGRESVAERQVGGHCRSSQPGHATAIEPSRAWTARCGSSRAGSDFGHVMETLWSS